MMLSEVQQMNTVFESIFSDVTHVNVCYQELWPLRRILQHNIKTESECMLLGLNPVFACSSSYVQRMPQRRVYDAQRREYHPWYRKN